MIDKATTDNIKEQAKRLETVDMLIKAIDKKFIWCCTLDCSQQKDYSTMNILYYNELAELPNMERAMTEARDLFNQHVELAARKELDNLVTAIKKDSK